MHPRHDSCLIEPKRGRREEPLPPLALLVFSPEDLTSFSTCFPTPPRRSHKLYLADVLIGSFERSEICLAGPMLGAPQTILVLERMIALGATKFIAAGWCGSLQNNVRIGDIVLPSSAISEEGTSSHYPGASPTPSPLMTTPLRSALTSSGLTVHEGSVWSTDAPFRETFHKVKDFQSAGVLSVDMETSALFTVSRFRNVDLAVVLVVSDDLSDFKWKHGFRDPAFKEARKKVVTSTLTAICNADGTISAP